MNQNYSVTHTRECEKDIDDIEYYISYHFGVPQIAEKLVDKLYSATLSLSDSPKRYKIYDKEPWNKRGLRYFYIDNYAIFCLVDDKNKEVVVLRIMYKARDFQKQLNISSSHYFVSDNTLEDLYNKG